MRKHLLRLIIAYACFELMRIIGAEIFSVFKGRPILAWADDGKALILRASSFVIMLCYLLSAFILFEKFYRNNKRKAIGFWILSVFTIISLRYIIQEKIFLYLLGYRNYYDDVPLLYYLVDNLYYALVYSAFGIVYFFLQNEQKVKLQQQQLELENKKAQLSFLHSQINPHFLFNSLNNIYSLIYYKSEASLEAISKLCDILRYMLYETSEKVSVSKEVDYIQKYIDLQMLRFEKPLNIDLHVVGDLKTVLIPPLILIPFVENAFKHGDLRHNETHIAIDLTANEKEVHFLISNRIGHNEKDETGGIGLSNIKKRLDLIYPGKHNLEIKKENGDFIIKMKLQNN